MKILKFVLYCLIIISLPLLIVSSVLRFTVNNIAVYQYIIDNYGIDRVTGIDNQQLAGVYQHWINYYNSKADNPQIQVVKNGQNMDLLSGKEVTHLQDVKGLMQLDYTVQFVVFIIMLSCAFVFIWLFRDWQRIFKGLFAGSALTFMIGALLAVAALTSFDHLFVWFHEVSFSNSFWILDPAKDYLIMMFPGGFFSDISIALFSAILMLAAVIGGLSYWLGNRNPKLVTTVPER
jgi:integral membrane protein (TIGR01906 family)